MNKILIICLFLLLSSMADAGKENPSLGRPKIKVIPIVDTALNRQYELYVKLPEEYSKNKNKAFPVIYFTDALWHIEILSGATEFLMEDAILVGISWQKDMEKKLLEEKGEHVSRFRDYTVGVSTNSELQAKYQLGQAHQHMEFIRNDVIQTIEKNYRTVSGHRSYFGYSAGGLFGAYILMAQPDTFDNYILGSPSVDGDIDLLSATRYQSIQKGKALKANVFISYGSLEKELADHIKEFINVLKKDGDEKLSVVNPIIEGSHQTAFPLTSVQAITWLSNLHKNGEKE